MVDVLLRARRDLAGARTVLQHARWRRGAHPDTVIEGRAINVDKLTQAPAGQTLRAVLGMIGPKSLPSFLAEGPGFDVRFTPPGVEAIVPSPTQPGRCLIGQTGVVADVTVEYSAALSTAVQSVTLTNEGQEPSPPIRELHAFALPLEVRARHAPTARGFGGGLTHGYYPPRAYREEEVCFGEARQWEWEGTSFTRWITGRRAYILETEPGGRSANPNLCLMQTYWSTGSPDGGEVGLWAALEWSARWELHMGTGFDGRFTFRGGPKIGGLVLQPGETLRLPRAHVGSFGGPGDARHRANNAVRHYVRDALTPDVGERRPSAMLAYDHWFGIEAHFDEALLRRQVVRAAEIGVEYFVVDAAWYGGAQQNFADGVGNWERVDEHKFPNGLEPFAEFVRSKGMQFGMWFEPERGRRGSDWVTQHPTWYWDSGHPQNLHLDLTQREVQDCVIEMLSGWARRLKLGWLRWDYNQQPGPFWDHIDPTGKVQFDYVEGLYRVWDALRERFPHLIIDNCASGGNRVDFGLLRRSHTMVISDHSEDPHICRLMQTGGSRVLPANYMNCSTYVGEHDVDKVGPLQLISRMPGTVMLNGHIANWSTGHTRLVKRHLDGYRTFRHLLMEDFHALSEYPRSPGAWDVVQFVHPSSREAVIMAFRMRGDEKTRTVRARHLSPDVRYEIRDPFTRGRPRIASGESLMATGLRLSAAPDSAVVRHLVPVPSSGG